MDKYRNDMILVIQSYCVYSLCVHEVQYPIYSIVLSACPAVNLLVNNTTNQY